VPEPAPPLSRRAARARVEADPAAIARHARAARTERVRRWLTLIVIAVLLAGGAAAVTAAIAGPVVDGPEAHRQAPPPHAAPTVDGLPVPAQTTVPTVSCDAPGVAAALSGGTDADVIAALGGAAAFREAVAAGAAPCVNLSEGARTWVVVNKLRPLEPVDYWPEPQERAAGVRQVSGGPLRADAAAALAQLAAASLAENAGEVAINSSFRSYDSQVRVHAGHVSQLGEAAADLVSARPGYSEHQTGLAVDLVACAGGCGALESFGGTTQAEWVAGNAWRFGFVVRYEDGYTATTGYEWEPWHLRYIGVELAAAYHDGGFHTLEDFFGLPAAPAYG